jgi:adenylate kinase family enzyme
MDYCAVQKFLQDRSKSQNVFNTLFHCHKIESYLEQHKIFEILGEVLIRVSIDQPENENVVDYLCQSLLQISQKFARNDTRLEFYNSTVDGSKMIKKLSTERRIPLIFTDKSDSNEIFKRIDRFLEKFNLQNHHLIICDFKKTDENNKFLRINQSTSQDKTSSSKPQDTIDIQLSDDFSNHRQINYIYDNIRNMKPRKMIKGNWNCRAMIVGRVGAGRKTQEKNLVKEFGLTFIDLDYLIKQYEQRPSLSNINNWGFWGFLQETLLKPNCLRNGYVIVCNVISLENLEILMEKFIYGPNRIIFIHTPEKECLRRWQRKATYRDDNIVFNYQLNLYNLHKKHFVEYFNSTKNKILHINGSKSEHDIKTLIFSYVASF